MPSHKPAKPREPEGRRLLVDGRPTFVPSTLTEVGRAEFPGGPPDLPTSLPSAEPPRRGRPPRQSCLSRINQDRKPTGDWVDDDELARDLAAIVGNRDERLDDGAEILPRLCGFVSHLFGRKLSPDERDERRKLVLVKRAPPSVIKRVLEGWRHGLGERDVRWMHQTLTTALDPADRNKPGKKKELTGQPIIRPDGRPMLDASGRPATHKPRPRVKLIYR